MTNVLAAFRRVRFAAVREIFRTFRPTLEGQRPKIAAAVLFSIMLVALEILAPWPIKFVIDAVLDKGALAHARIPGLGTLDAQQTVLVASGALVLISILVGFLRVRTAVLGAEVGRRVATRVRRQIFDHLQHLPLAFHTTHRSGDLILRLSGDVNMIRDLLVTTWINLLQRGLTLVAMAIMLIVISPILFLLALAPLPLIGWSVRRSSRKLQSVARKQRSKEGSSASFAAESLRQIRVIKAYGAETGMTRSFTRESRSGERSGAKGARISAGLARNAEILSSIGLAGLLCVGADLVLSSELTAGTLVVAISYARAVYKPLRGISKEGVRLGRSSVSAERLLELLRSPGEDLNAGVACPEFEGAVAFEDLAFRHQGETSWILDGFNAKVKAGTFAVLSGPNGSGKSTTLALLLRLLSPTRGRITIDGTPITSFSLRSYRARTSYVPQEIQLFGTTVRENLLLARPEATDEDLWAALKLAFADDIVRRLGDGLDSELGESGCTLSGGEARRIMLARAALRDPDLLLLDEPLTGIDVPSRPLVARAIRQIARGRTTIVVSHESIDELRPDCILSLEPGQMPSPELLFEGGPVA